MIRVLHVIRAMNMAGAETFIMNVYRHIDREKIQFDFLVNVFNECDYDNEIIKLGGRIYAIPRYYLINHSLYKRACNSFFQTHPEHSIVHGHIGSSAPVYLPQAKKNHKYTIAHSHNAMNNDSIQNIAFNQIARKVRGRADYYFACSLEAGINRFGTTITESKHFSVVNNGIDIAKYRRTQNSIKAAKQKFSVGDAPVFLHIGRFDAQKNHDFLIDVFSVIRQELPSAKLLLVGEGEEFQKIKSKVSHLNLESSVLFLGVRSDIPDVLRASDVFLFPSISEGLGIALIEAQASGLPCVVSSQIPELACLTPLVTKLNLDSSHEWAQTCIDAYSSNKLSYPDYSSIIKAKGFDIRETANWLSDFYLTASKKY